MNFTESTQKLNNPDRGYYIQIDTEKHQKMANLAEDVRLVLLAFDVEAFTETKISEEKIRELEDALIFAKEHHISVVFRAAYGFHEDGIEPMNMELMKTHIAQISEILNKYKDNVLVIQAGMLGEYGEWHTSKYLEGDENAQRKSRVFILKSWETYLDDSIKVAVRRQRFVREAMEEGVLKGRLGIHNDALLSTESDMGTYDDTNMDRSLELEWTQENLKRQINGGEMPTLGKKNQPKNAHQEFKMLHLSYLNLEYNKKIIDNWLLTEMNDTNAKEYIERHLGYRLYISELEMYEKYYENQIRKKGLTIMVTFRNTGYASLPSKYKMYVIVSSQEKEYYQEIKCEDIYNISNGETTKMRMTILLPEEFMEKSEEMTVGIKFAQNKMETEAINCIQLANKEGPYRNGSNGILELKKEKESMIPMLGVSALIE